MNLPEHKSIIGQCREYYFLADILFNERAKVSGPFYWITKGAGRQNQVLRNLQAYKHILKVILGKQIQLNERVLESTDPNALSKLLSPNEQDLFILEHSQFQEKIPSIKELTQQQLHFSLQDHYQLDEILTTIQSWGYEREYEVNAKGQFALRGGILDLFPKESEYPLRIEFFGSTLESMRLFDPLTQISQETKITSYALSATTTSKISKKAHLDEYIPHNAFFILDSDDITAPINNNQENKYQNLTFSQTQPQLSKPEQYIPLPSFRGRIHDFTSSLQQKIKNNYTIIIVTRQSARLLETLNDRDITLTNCFLINETLLSPGWIDEKNKTILYTDYEIFGLISSYSSSQQYLSPQITAPFVTLTPGCHVTHIDHGIGKFLGISQQTVSDIVREYLVIEFAKSDKIYVPTSKIDRITRYISSPDAEPELSSLNSSRWQQTKKKIKKSIDNYSKELIAIYAKRASQVGFAFPHDDYIQREIALAFPFVETPDQKKAIEEVKKDMESPHPMDRLICGDVGFGKTEVALRAAVKAVSGGKQVAILAPTTILAEQHRRTFSQRLKSYPISIAALSRMRKAAEITAAKKAIQEGKVDIIIGTHRLLQSDIVWKDLGLLIVDEEQRFGVKAKERLKEQRASIDILTLTATPIPRTLQFSLSGIRDISVLSSPPPGRLPIKTIVTNYNENLLRKAITDEIKHGGQVFVIYNRVQTILHVAHDLAKLIPEITIGVAHGQMKPSELEEQLYAFMTGTTNCLVATNIIENGIDIPNANTLIVINANHFGLSDLYQMRGRVGRSNTQAYAYLLYKQTELPKNQLLRLKTLEELSDLGSGFELAMRDLDMRGAGNTIGTEQSGFINEIGIELYTRLVRQEVETLKSQIKHGKLTSSPTEENTEITFQNAFRPEIDLPLTAYIPQSYISDAAVRLYFYQSLGLVTHKNDLKKIQKEITDRFGKIPTEVDNIFFIENLRLWAQNNHILGIKQQSNNVIFFPEVLSEEIKETLKTLWTRTFIIDGQVVMKSLLQEKNWKKYITLE